MEHQAGPSNTPFRPSKGSSEPLPISNPNVKGKQPESEFQPQVNPASTARPPTPPQAPPNPHHQTHYTQPPANPPDNRIPQSFDQIPKVQSVLDGSHIRTQEQAIEHMLIGANQLHQAPQNGTEELCAVIRQYISKIPLNSWY